MKPPPPIHPDLLTFLNYTRFQVTAEDIARHVMSDPGSDGYRKSWESIRAGGRIPEGADFDLSEGGGGWLAMSCADDQPDPSGFLAFRRLTTAVGLVLISWDRHNGEEFIPLNYLALNMVRDLIPGKRPYLEMVRNALSALQTFLHGYPDFEEYPFLLLAEILLAQKAKDFADADRTAGVLLEAESDLRRRDEWLEGEPFLLGLTHYKSLHMEWLSASSGLTNPNNNPEMELLMGLLEELRL